MPTSPISHPAERGLRLGAAARSDRGWKLRPARKPIFRYAVSALDRRTQRWHGRERESAGSIAGSDFVLNARSERVRPDSRGVADRGRHLHARTRTTSVCGTAAGTTSQEANYVGRGLSVQGSSLRRDASFILDCSSSSFSLGGSLELGASTGSGPTDFWTECACGSEKRQVVIGVTDVDWNCDNLSTTPLTAATRVGQCLNRCWTPRLAGPALRRRRVGAGARLQLATGPAGEEPPFSEVLAAARRITDAVPPTAAPPSPPPPSSLRRLARSAHRDVASCRHVPQPSAEALPRRPRSWRLDRARAARACDVHAHPPSRIRVSVVRLRSGEKVTKVGAFGTRGGRGVTGSRSPAASGSAPEGRSVPPDGLRAGRRAIGPVHDQALMRHGPHADPGLARCSRSARARCLRPGETWHRTSVLSAAASA